MRARILEKKEIADNTLWLSLEPEQPIQRQAGQYLVLNLPNPKYSDEKGSSRVLSIVSSPDERYLEIATRLSESAFKRSLNELKVGDPVEVKAIGGKFMLPGPERRIVMIAGGIGITPFISMLRGAWKRAPGYDITLFFSNRTLKSTAFLSELQQLAKVNQKFHLVLTMTREEGWKGENSGRIDEEFVKRYVKNPAECIFMIIGPREMVAELSGVLKGLGVSEEQILHESFGN